MYYLRKKKHWQKVFTPEPLLGLQYLHWKIYGFKNLQFKTINSIKRARMILKNWKNIWIANTKLNNKFWTAWNNYKKYFSRGLGQNVSRGRENVSGGGQSLRGGSLRGGAGQISQGGGQSVRGGRANILGGGALPPLPLPLSRHCLV